MNVSIHIIHMSIQLSMHMSVDLDLGAVVAVAREQTAPHLVKQAPVVGYLPQDECVVDRVDRTRDRVVLGLRTL